MIVLFLWNLWFSKKKCRGCPSPSISLTFSKCLNSSKKKHDVLQLQFRKYLNLVNAPRLITNLYSIKWRDFILQRREIRKLELIGLECLFETVFIDRLKRNDWFLEKIEVKVTSETRGSLFVQQVRLQISLNEWLDL